MSWLSVMAAAAHMCALVNAEMLRQGKATVDTSARFAHLEEFKRLEKEAQDAGRGIWPPHQ